MVMDQPLRRFYGSLNRLNPSFETLSVSLDKNLGNGFKVNNNFVSQNHVGVPVLPPNPTPSGAARSLNLSQEGDAHEDYDFSDVVLKYINQMLMEEDMEEKNCMFQESSAALQAAEKSLYELIGEKYPPSPDSELVSFDDQYHESPAECHDINSNSTGGTSSDNGMNFADRVRNDGSGEDKSSIVTSWTTSLSSQSSANNAANILDGFVDSPVSTPRIPDIFTDSDSIMQFKRGFEEASKFLPKSVNLSVDLENNGLFLEDLKEDDETLVVKVDKKLENEYSLDGSRGKKNPHPEDVYTECGRTSKQSATCSGTIVSSKMFDMVLLQCGPESGLPEALRNGTTTNAPQNDHVVVSNGGKYNRKKQGGKKDAVDLRTLLTLCAQAVAADDRRLANELLKQIRQHSSPMGDGMQRMAHYFADGLEARLAGSGTQVYTAFITKPVSAADVLKGYHLFMAACPFRKLSNFFANKTIMNVAEKATRLHIIDFGILYGFQWPCLIQRLSSRVGGPPRLRITGIDLPQPGFRPAERVEETGRRLANYAETFRVPFGFNAIAQKWDTIKIEDLKIESDEVLVVNCLYRFRNLLDETVVADSPRNKVLNLIRDMNPEVFVQGIVNGAYNAPFFITRFREALFHYSTLFDMLETTLPSEIEERMLIEREMFGREAMNVIACEGAERIERPETYKQWQLRNMRAGFRQLPLNEEIKKMAKERVTEHYHKDFVIEEDSQWLLQGWKGRIVYALSSWTPAS